MSGRRPGLIFIFITLFLDIVGIGLVIPILPKLLESFLGNDTSQAARYYGFFAATYAVMQLIFAPVLGGLSDRFGRRAVLLTALFGSSLDYLLMAFAPSWGWLLLGRALSGLSGASIGPATAYIADVSPPEKRAANFGLIGMAFGLGFIAGPALGGLLGHYGLRVPFFVAAGLTFLNMLYGFFVLPESLPKENRRPFTLKNANPLGTLVALKKYPVVIGLAASYFLVGLAQRGLENVWVLYTGYRYQWDVRHVGLSLTAVGLAAAVVQGGLVRRIIPALGERKTLVFGMAVALVSSVCYGLATQGWMIYAIIAFGAFGGLAQPAAMGLMSRAVPPTEQGLLQGGLSSMSSITQVVGPPIASNLFSTFVGPGAPVELPGISFFVGAVFILGGLVLAVRTFRRLDARSPDVTPAAAAEPGV